jgi:hypothetical protein
MLRYKSDDDTQGSIWISEFKSMEKLSEQLTFILLILYQLDTDTQELFRADIEHFESIYANLKFMRQVKHRDGLVDDHPIEYYGRDYGAYDPFKYKDNTEKQINSISLEIMGVLGRIIRTTRERGIVIGDEMG